MTRFGAARLPAVLAIGLLLTGCSSGPAASLTPLPTTAPTVVPTPTAGSTASATMEPTHTPATTNQPLPTAGAVGSPSEVEFANQIAMRVTVAELNLREQPSATARKLGLAKKNAVFVVADWPVEGDGFMWYRGHQIDLPAAGVLPQLPDPYFVAIEATEGWLAAGTETNPFLMPIAPRCPDAPSLENLHGMLDSEMLACFGSSSIAIQGTFGCPGCGGTSDGLFTPDWLAGPLDAFYLSATGTEFESPLALRAPPSLPKLPADGSILEVQGHFDDPAAHACSIALPPITNPDGLPAQIDARAALDYCRVQFVIEYFEVLGTDPTFEGG